MSLVLYSTGNIQCTLMFNYVQKLSIRLQNFCEFETLSSSSDTCCEKCPKQMYLWWIEMDKITSK